MASAKSKMKAKLGRQSIGTDVRQYSTEHACISNVMVMLCNASGASVCNSNYSKIC